MPQKITTDMSVATIIELTPDSVVIMNNAGLKCTGCNVDTTKPLKNFLKSFDEKAVDKLLDHLNKLKQTSSEPKTPEKKDFKLHEIIEGNKRYYKIAGLTFTESAYKNLHQLSEKRGLRIRLVTGGCSGFKYEYDFYDQPEANEKTYQLSDSMAIYMDDFTFDRSYGSVIDFTIGLHSSGLQIINPRKKRACSCGTSISF